MKPKWAKIKRGRWWIWSKKEIKFLKRQVGKMLVSEIADCLGRNKSSIFLKASKLGLPTRTPESYGVLTLEKIREFAPNALRTKIVKFYRKDGHSSRTVIFIACPIQRPHACVAVKPRWVPLGVLRKTSGRCSSCGCFKGGSVNNKGYRIIRVNGKNTFEHRYVMDLYLRETTGFGLRENQTVHHRNGIRSDNRIENLELWNGSHGPGARITDLEKDAVQHLIELGYLVVRREDVSGTFIHQ